MPTVTACPELHPRLSGAETGLIWLRPERHVAMAVQGGLYKSRTNLSEALCNSYSQHAVPCKGRSICPRNSGDRRSPIDQDSDLHTAEICTIGINGAVVPRFLVRPHVYRELLHDD